MHHLNPFLLKHLRERSGLTARGLAALAGVSHTTIIRIEQGGQTPTPPTVKAIADALGVPVAALLDYSGEAAYLI